MRLLLAACFLFGSSTVLTTPTQRADASRPPTGDTTSTSSSRALIDGIQIYYEVHGKRDGTPLVLLHGGGSTIDSTFGRMIPLLARTRRVIALEEQGHGRTSDRDQPFTFEQSADDVAGLLRHLDVSQADILGFSNGANVALQVAVRHPTLVHRLVFASSFTRRDGAQPQLWEFIQQANIANMPQALKDAFLAVNPDPRKLKAMHDKDAARMAGFADVPDAAVQTVLAPTLIVMGDRDVARLEHALQLSRLFPHARLLVLPSGHGDYLAEASSAPDDTGYAEITARLVLRFLSNPYPAR
ncbi:MAG: alpha/beta fold hydrolase [Vicinamibacterales bacterium]